MPLTAAIYCRISSDQNETRLGVARQEADCRALAERKSWTVAEVFVDNDVSAASGRTRPAYGRLLDAIKAGEVGAVVTWDADRLHRRPIELEEFFNVCDAAGLHQLATVGGDVDLSTGEGVMVARIKGAVAAEEVRKIKSRTCRKKVEIAESGRPSGGGRRAFGFGHDRVTHEPAEAGAIRQAAARVLAGESLGAIVSDLNTAGPAPVGGQVWRTNAIRKVLVAPRTVGLRQHRGDVVGQAAWEPILDRATWERVRAILLDPRRRVNGEARHYLLSGGVARCGACGGRMVGKPSRGRHAYACLKALGGCGGRYINADGLNDLVTEALLLRLDTPHLVEALSRPNDVSARPAPDLAALEARMTELAEMFAAGEVGRADWLTARRGIESRLDAARRTLAKSRGAGALAAYVGRAGALRAAWPTMTFDKRRAVVTALIDRVTIGPAVPGRNTFDGTRVDVTWKA